MNQTFTAVVKNDGEWWIGWVEEVPGVNCQERSREALLKTLRNAHGSTGDEPRRCPGRRGKGLRRTKYRGMKRRDLLRHLSSHGCSLLREGGGGTTRH